MSQASNYENQVLEPLQATILSGQTTSDIINASGATIKTVYLPAAFTGTALNFQVSHDGVNFFDYQNINDLKVEITCTQNKAYGLFANDFFSNKYVKIVSNATEAAERIITLIPAGI